MSQLLSVELSDKVIANIERRAAIAGTSPAHVAAKTLEQQFGDNTTRGVVAPLSGASGKVETSIERYFGKVKVGTTTGSDNDSIDADLARVYGHDHTGG